MDGDARQRVLPESAEDLLVSSPALMIWASRADGACTFFSEGWLRFRGRRLEEELGDGWADGVHPDDLARCLGVYHRALRRQEPFRMTYRLRAADGSWRWIADQGSARFTPEGAFAGMLGACVELTPAIRPSKPLSPAELPLLATHLSRAEMARHCFLSPHTIASHMRSIYRKLGVNSRSEAVARAEALGLANPLAVADRATDESSFELEVPRLLRQAGAAVGRASDPSQRALR
jgi:PAS domain S-box-containing protein